MGIPRDFKERWSTWIPRLSVLAMVMGAIFWVGLGALNNYVRGGNAVMPPTFGAVRAPEFPKDIEWLNTDRPLRIRDLRGKIVLIDFWTYCCINCIHVIPDLKNLEKKYPNELVVIGVHSAKFTTERETDNIRQAILRYEIEHPVANDSEMEVWNLYAVRAWPTLVLIGPDGKIVGQMSGEGVFEPFDQAISALIREYDAAGSLDRTPLKLKLEREKMPESLLAFPGKVLADEKSNQLFIADSNHNRIVVVGLEDASVKAIIGEGEIGLKDGGFEEAQLHHPQGMAFDGASLYVADTENHAIRRVDFDKRTVTTIAGTGEQARRYNVSGVGTKAALNSPWDLVLHNGNLYIAMAGSHQIWVMDLKSNEVRPYAGSSSEARVDGPLQSAALAQPSGLATDGTRLYFADSEVSAIRAADLDPKGKVVTIAGGDLFDFGDTDGVGLSARFQHPLGVAHNNGDLYVADTYNNKIRLITLADQMARTLFGSGEEGRRDGDKPTFDEPGGISYANGKLYIADTNNHAIRVADLKTTRVETLAIKEMAKLAPRSQKTFRGESITMPPQIVAPGQATLAIDLKLPAGLKLNPQAPSAVTIASSGTQPIVINGGATKTFASPQFPLRVPVTLNNGAAELQVDYVIYYCEAKDESLCYFKEARVRVPIKSTDANGKNELSVEYNLTAGK